MSLSKQEIVDRIHERLSYAFTRKQSVEVLEMLLEIIKGTLESGEDVLVSRFGKFSVKEKNERKGRNPATGEDMALRKRRVVTFRSSTVLREKLNIDNR